MALLSSISGISNTPSAQSVYALGGDTTTAPRVQQKKLGQDDFLKLLAKQFQSQDPMKPMEDTAFIAQMAQFSALEQSSALVREVAQLRTLQDVTTANSYLGRKVTLDLGHNGTAVGNVAGVDVSSGSPLLVVDGVKYPLSAVLLVEPGVVTAPLQPAPAGGA